MINESRGYDDISEMLRTCIGRNKLKYSLLKELLKLNQIDSIHINLDSIFSFITAKYLSKSDEIDSSYRYTIASSILNTVAHYRHFCIKNNWLPSIYLYSSNKWNEAIESALPIIEIISNYLDKIYFIKVNKNDLPCVYMKYFVSDKKNNLILTKDLLDLQLISNNTHIIHLNKDNSIYYCPDNLYDALYGKEIESKLSYKLIGPILFYSGIGSKNKGVKGFGKKKTIDLFNKLVDKGSLANGQYNSYEDFNNDVSKEIQVDLSNFYDSFKKYDLKTNYNLIMTSGKQKNLDNYIIDKFSKKDLLDLNNKYFAGFDSLILEYLIELPAKFKKSTNQFYNN